MSGLYLALAFAAGWVSCWKLSGWILRKVLRRPSTFTADTLARIRHENLIKLRNQVAAELEKRRAS